MNRSSRACSSFLRHFNNAAPALSSFAIPDFSAQNNQQTLAGHQNPCTICIPPEQGSAAL